MTLTLKLTATAAATGAGAGVNFNRDLAAHLTDFTPYQMPLFLNATGQTETTQIVHLATPLAGQESATRFVALGGMISITPSPTTRSVARSAALPSARWAPPGMRRPAILR